MTQGQQKQGAHTPIPWSVDHNGGYIHKLNPDGTIFTMLFEVRGFGHFSKFDDGMDIMDANIDYAVHCVNSHDALVEALEVAVHMLDSLDERGKLDQLEALSLNDMEAALTLAKES